MREERLDPLGLTSSHVRAVNAGSQGRTWFKGIPRGSVVKNLPANAGHKRHGFDPWVRKIPWRRAWQPTQYSCLENSMDRGAWRATAHRVAQSLTRLKQPSMCA